MAAAKALKLAVQVIQRADEAATVLQPERHRILEMLATPGSASSLARELGVPRQKINYHLQLLEKGGFVELVEERRKGNCVERVVRATAESYLISPSALGRLGQTTAEVRDKFSAAYLLSVAARAINDLAILRERADKAHKRLATLTLESEIRFTSAESRSAFTEELASTLAQLVAKYHDERAEGGRAFRLFLGAYPVNNPGNTKE